MRKLEYLSPSSISQFDKNLEEFYLVYLSEIRAPRFPQTQAMSIGSAFDAYVKNFLHEHLFGKGKDPKFELQTLFEAQVEEQNRDWAWEHGAHAFQCYKNSGALADLMLELQSSLVEPRFEIEVRGVVNGFREGITKKMDSGPVLLGKPDVFYVNKDSCQVLLDFKVNGWCSKGTTSPMKGYLRIRSGSGQPIVSGPHKDCIPMSHRGMMINCGLFLEQCNQQWADQLTIYGWLCGCDVGNDFIVAIDQMACKNVGQKFPETRIAEHRLRVQSDYQWNLYAKIQHIWELIHSNHIFRDMSLEDSRIKCEQLDRRASELLQPKTAEDAMFNAMTRV